MEILIYLFGEGPDLNVLQISLRSIVVFFIALMFLRIAGRRSFGMRAPFDQVIIVLLGAILSRAIIGASPFINTIASCFIITVLHRLVAYSCFRYSFLNSFFKGNPILLYKNGELIDERMRRSLSTRDDVMAEARLRIHENELQHLSEVYMERNGEISFVRDKRPS